VSTTAHPGPAPVASVPLTAANPPLIRLEGVEKVYRPGKVEFPALRGIDLTIDDGDMVAIVGPSGSGKSTIMNRITGIHRPSAGTVMVDGRLIDEMSEEELAIWRGARVGVVIALVGTVILALVVMLAPLRRAVGLKPGQALRYA
jgi:predicted ABC-type transport system involved in lysophospholipase L1 biosynthesis ATPase subunit